MSVVIGDLKWQNDKKQFHDELDKLGHWWSAMTVLKGYKGKATLNLIDLFDITQLGNLCDIPYAGDIFVDSKEVEIKTYSTKLSIPRCSLKSKHLSSLLKKGANSTDENEIFLDNLINILFKANNSEFLGYVIGDVLAEAAADANVSKIAVPAVTNPDSASTAIKAFIDGLPPAIVSEALSDEKENEYVHIFVSTELLALLHRHYDDSNNKSSYNKDDGKSMFIEGYKINAIGGFSGSQMLAVNLSNVAIFIDDENDVDDFKVIYKEEINTDLIIGAISLAGSFLDSYKLAISNNF